jgi:hypothetical protein
MPYALCVYLDRANFSIDDTKSQYPERDPESLTLHQRPHRFSETEAFFNIIYPGYYQSAY